MIKVNVPSDKCGDYCKKGLVLVNENIVEKRDAYGNYEYEVSKQELDKFLEISGLTIHSADMLDIKIHSLMMGNHVYGQIWYNEQEYKEWKEKTAGIW